MNNNTASQQEPESGQLEITNEKFPKKNPPIQSEKKKRLSLRNIRSKKNENLMEEEEEAPGTDLQYHIWDTLNTDGVPEENLRIWEEI